MRPRNAQTILMLLLAAPSPAAAKGAGGAQCAIMATPLAFGRYIPFSGTPSDFTATLTLACTATGKQPVPVEGTVALLGGAGGPSGRTLRTGARALRYQLYRDAGRTLLWGGNAGEGAADSFSGMVAPHSQLRQTLIVYGRILARQSNAATGNYTDAIIAQMNY